MIRLSSFIPHASSRILHFYWKSGCMKNRAHLNSLNSDLECCFEWTLSCAKRWRKILVLLFFPVGNCALHSWPNMPRLWKKRKWQDDYFPKTVNTHCSLQFLFENAWFYFLNNYCILTIGIKWLLCDTQQCFSWTFGCWISSANMGSYPFSFLGQFILHKGENDNLSCRQRMFSSHGRKDESCFYLISF